jgi:hypothetical protein
MAYSVDRTARLVCTASRVASSVFCINDNVSIKVELIFTHAFNTSHVSRGANGTSPDFINNACNTSLFMSFGNLELTKFNMHTQQQHRKN